MRILFVLGSGGHTTRGLILSRQVRAEKTFIIPWESEVTRKKVEHNYFRVISPRFRAKDNVLMTVARTLFLFLHSFLILIIARPNIVISTGSGLTIPPFFLARFLRIRTIYIESPSRVYEPSIAGKLLIGRVDMWLSSWPDLAERYRGIQYRGMIF